MSVRPSEYSRLVYYIKQFLFDRQYLANQRIEFSILEKLYFGILKVLGYFILNKVFGWLCPLIPRCHGRRRQYIFKVEQLQNKCWIFCWYFTNIDLLRFFAHYTLCFNLKKILQYCIYPLKLLFFVQFMNTQKQNRVYKEFFFC